MARILPPYRPVGEDDYGRRSFLKSSVAMVGGAGFTTTLGSLFSQLHAADEAADNAKKEPYKTGKNEAAVKTGEFFFPRLKFHVRDQKHDIWDVGPSGDVILRRKLSELTNINCSQDPVVVELDDLEKMSRYPYVFMTSETEFDLLPKHAENLREFLMRGGFIHADDCCHPNTKGRIIKSDLGENFVYHVREGEKGNTDGDRFFMDYIRIVNQLFPDNPMRRIPDDHEIYRCYFNYPKGCPIMQGVDHGAWGLFEKGTGRLMTVATPGDLHCGWMCRYWAPEKNLDGIKMGINVLMYYLTH